MREGMTAAEARAKGEKIVASIPDDAILESYETHKGQVTQIAWRWSGGGCSSVPCYTTIAQVEEAFGKSTMPGDLTDAATAYLEPRKHMCIACGWHGTYRAQSRCPMCGQRDKLRMIVDSKVVYRDDDPQMKAENVNCPVAPRCREGGHTLTCSACREIALCEDGCICVCHCPTYDPTQGGRFKKGDPAQDDFPVLLERAIDNFNHVLADKMADDLEKATGVRLHPREPVPGYGDDGTVFLDDSDVLVWVDDRTQRVCLRDVLGLQIRISEEDVPALAEFLFGHAK